MLTGKLYMTKPAKNFRGRAVPDSAESPQIANIRRSWIISFKELF